MTDAAAQLGVTRAALSRVLNCRAAVSPEMSLRLEGRLGVENGASPKTSIAAPAHLHRKDGVMRELGPIPGRSMPWSFAEHGLL